MLELVEKQAKDLTTQDLTRPPNLQALAISMRMLLKRTFNMEVKLTHYQNELIGHIFGQNRTITSFTGALKLN